MCLSLASQRGLLRWMVCLHWSLFVLSCFLSFLHVFLRDFVSTVSHMACYHRYVAALCHMHTVEIVTSRVFTISPPVFAVHHCRCCFPSVIRNLSAFVSCISHVPLPLICFSDLSLPPRFVSFSLHSSVAAGTEGRRFMRAVRNMPLVCDVPAVVLGRARVSNNSGVRIPSSKLLERKKERK